MTAEEAFVEMLARVAAAKTIFITELELNQWPPNAVTALKAQKLVTKAQPANSVVCPGCEEACSMPVEQIHAASGKPTLFVVCDKRDDINRVTIEANQLIRWQASLTNIARFIGHCLSLRWNGAPTESGEALQIGIVKGRKKSQMLCLCSEKELNLLAGSNQLPLAEVIEFAKERYGLDVETITQLVDATTTSEARYTPSNARREARKLETQERYETWNKEYRQLKKAKPGMSKSWYATKISKMDIADRKSSETIRKNMI